MDTRPLYKFVPTEDIARRVSLGFYRFYELTKYRKVEENTGRSDTSEGSIGFTDEEIGNDVHKLPIGSFNGVNFYCNNISLDDDYIKQYFVFCMSTKNSIDPILGCRYAVELSVDIFDTFEMLLSAPADPRLRNGVKFFSHAPVEYYDIDNHPTPIIGEQWREVYVKHANFSYQFEYRAAVFASDHFFERTRKQPAIYERKIRDRNGIPYDFNLKIVARSGTDDYGWRYIEFDISEFQAKFLPDPSKILVRDF